MQNTAQQNYPDLVASYDTQPGNNVGLFYNAPEPHGACTFTVFIEQQLGEGTDWS